MTVETGALVIGDGPGGSTTAARLAERGRRVLLLGKDRHRDFTSANRCCRSIFRCSRRWASRRRSHVGLVECAAEFRSMNHEKIQVFEFAGGLGTPLYAYRVRRSEFCRVLLDHARARGVGVRAKDRGNKTVAAE